MLLADSPVTQRTLRVPLPKPRRFPWWIVARIGLLALLPLGGWFLYDTLAGSNFHTVIPGSVYRCSQPTPEFLNDTIKKYKIRTVLNLKGCSDPTPWYLEESRVAATWDVSLEDISMSASRLPSVYAIRELVEILDRTEYPVLIHCNRGIDRTGLVAAMAILLHTDASLASARQEMSVLHGHLALSHTAHLDRFYDLYEQWLFRQGQTHTSALFRRWLLYGYCPGECSATLEATNLSGRPAMLPRQTPFAVRVHCLNTSVSAWQFKPGNNAGIHAVYTIVDEQDTELFRARAGLFRATVHPGSSIDLDLALPPLPPGRYTLRADLIDEQHAYFFQTGSEPLIVEIEVL